MLARIAHVVVFAVSLGLAGACAKDSSAPATSASPAPERVAGLTRIADPSLVCMVNNTYMGKAQIPVEVAGKTYFGCCPMCKDRLINEPATRTAVDPVTGESVDKASAVLAQDADGSVLYFASEQTLRGYHAAP